jgi:hypothetical protein
MSKVIARDSNLVIQAIRLSVRVQRVRAGEPVANPVKQQAFGINLCIRAQDDGLMAAELKLIEHVRADFLVESSQRCVYD